MGRYVEAGQAFEKVLNFMPHISANYSNYGLALLQSGKTNQAVNALQKAVALDRENRPANELLALIMKAQKNSEKVGSGGQSAGE